MSHFTRVKTEMTCLKAVAEVMTNMGYVRNFTNLMNGWQAAVRKVEVSFKTTGPYDIGFIKNPEGKIEVLGDWWGIRTTTGIEQENFVSNLKNSYYTLKVSKNSGGVNNHVIYSQVAGVV